MYEKNKNIYQLKLLKKKQNGFRRVIKKICINVLFITRTIKISLISKIEICMFSYYKELDSIALKKKFIPSVLLSSESDALSG